MNSSFAKPCDDHSADCLDKCSLPSYRGDRFDNHFFYLTDQVSLYTLERQSSTALWRMKELVGTNGIYAKPEFRSPTCTLISLKPQVRRKHVCNFVLFCCLVIFSHSAVKEGICIAIPLLSPVFSAIPLIKGDHAADVEYVKDADYADPEADSDRARAEMEAQRRQMEFRESELSFLAVRTTCAKLLPVRTMWLLVHWMAS